MTHITVQESRKSGLSERPHHNSHPPRCPRQGASAPPWRNPNQNTGSVLEHSLVEEPTPEVDKSTGASSVAEPTNSDPAPQSQRVATSAQVLFDRELDVVAVGIGDDADVADDFVAIHGAQQQAAVFLGH